MSTEAEELLRARIRADADRLGPEVTARLLEHAGGACLWEFDADGAARCSVHDVELAPPRRSRSSAPTPRAAVLVCARWDGLPLTFLVATGALRRRCEACRALVAVDPASLELDTGPGGVMCICAACAKVLTPRNAPVHLAPGSVEWAERLGGRAFADGFAALAGMPACEVLL